MFYNHKKVAALSDQNFHRLFFNSIEEVPFNSIEVVPFNSIEVVPFN